MAIYVYIYSPPQLGLLTLNLCQASIFAIQNRAPAPISDRVNLVYFEIPLLYVMLLTDPRMY